MKNIINLESHAGCKFRLNSLIPNEKYTYKFEIGDVIRMVRYKIGTNYTDTRTHNIDLIGEIVWIENSNSQMASYVFKDKDDALEFYSWLTGFKNKQLLKLKLKKIIK